MRQWSKLGSLAMGWVCGACLLAVLVLLSVVNIAVGSQAGRLDPTFGERGRVSTPLDVTEKFSGAVELGVGPDGSAVLAERETLVRFRPDGSRDRDFGRGGELFLKPGTASEGVAERKFLANTMTVDGHGRILVFGEQADGREGVSLPGYNGSMGATSAMVLRFEPGGEPDHSFGGGMGFIREDFGLVSMLPAESTVAPTEIPLVSAMTGSVDSQDRPLLVAGATFSVGGCGGKGVVTFQPRALVRLTESGALDSSFGGGDGISPLEGSTSFPRLEIDGANEAVVDVGRIGDREGICHLGTDLLRFDQGGERLLSFGAGTGQVRERGKLDLVEPSGKTILSYGKRRTAVVVRLQADGTRDPGFGESGAVRVPLQAVRAHVKPVAVDGKGRILLAGFIVKRGRPGEPTQHTSSFVVTRLHADGRLDRSFGERGWVITPFARPLRLTSATAALDPRGRLLVAGTVSSPESESGGFVLARYLLGPQ
jgi:uncharacterized delta-60 repeat protein